MNTFGSTEVLNTIESFCFQQEINGYFLEWGAAFLSPCAYIWPQSVLQMQIHR